MSSDLTDEQNARIRTVFRHLLNLPGQSYKTQGALGRAVGMQQSAVSGFLGERQGTSYAVAVNACRLAGLDYREVLGLPATSDEVRCSHTKLELVRLCAMLDGVPEDFAMAWESYDEGLSTDRLISAMRWDCKRAGRDARLRKSGSMLPAAAPSEPERQSSKPPASRVRATVPPPATPTGSVSPPPAKGTPGKGKKR